ncbi:MAG: response regulator, partial [Hymenobacter sp.]
MRQLGEQLAAAAGAQVAGEGGVDVGPAGGFGGRFIPAKTTTQPAHNFEPLTHTATKVPTGTLLLIDDEARLRQLLAQVLELEGYTVLQAPDAYRGLALLGQHAAEVLVVLSDVKLPDAHGVDLLPRFKALAPEAEVVLLTAFGTIPDGVRAMKQGAFDYLTKGDFEQQLVV